MAERVLTDLSTDQGEGHIQNTAVPEVRVKKQRHDYKNDATDSTAPRVFEPGGRRAGQ